MSQLAVIGLGTMGANLARNAARNGAQVFVYNRTTEKMQEFVSQYGSEGMFVPCNTYDEMLSGMSSPRAILLMVNAGAPVDAVIDELLPKLSTGDIIVDGGNSHYRDSEKRAAKLAAAGVRFLGLGVSGGHEGALKGPSMMPGGDRSAYEELSPLFQKMAAQDGIGGQCVSYLGPAGAGHFVKTVHNGIEYAVMQLIAESVDVLHRLGGMSHAHIADSFAEWQKDEWLQSFLLGITVETLRLKDSETGKDMVDVIQDKAGQKGTGRWTTEAALLYGVSTPTITAALDARVVSAAKEFRVKKAAQSTLHPLEVGVDKEFSEQVRSALELSVLNAYAQGFHLLSVASEEEKWALPFSEIARIWRGGCIIRAGILGYWQRMMSGDTAAESMVAARASAEAQQHWRSVVALGALRAIPLPAMASALSYYDAYRTARLPQYVVQAQRDFFGSHGFERVDKEGVYHLS